jgi:hypothetical protein
MTGIFGADDQASNPLDALVGEGKKYATVEDLAKSRVAADEHITRIERENAEYREGIERNIREQQSRQNTPPAQVQDLNVPAQRAPQEDLAERIREVTRQDREAAETTSNVTEVTDRLTSTFGGAEAANAAVKAKAQELGVSVQFLQDVASKSPKAFYKQMDLDAQPRQAPAPHSNVNTGALHNQSAGTQAKAGTYAYYQDIRRTNPKLYSTPKVQLEMHKQALENPNFY